MTQTLKVFGERAAARLGLALVLALAATVLPTVVHALWTQGPLSAFGDLVILVHWMIVDLTPSLPDWSSFTVVGSV